MEYCRIASDVILGKGVRIYGFVNLYGCEIGDDTLIGTFVEVQKNASIGKLCKISSHSFVCEGVHIEDEVFIGHGVMFTNVLVPRATNKTGALQTEEDWSVMHTYVKRGASVGSGAVIVCGVTIGEHAMVGAGSVVTKDIPAGEIWLGNPARFIRKVNSDE